MNCRVCQELLQQHLDGLGSEEVLQRHLHACPLCFPQIESIRKFLLGLQLLRQPVPFVDLSERLVSSLLDDHRARRVRRQRRRAYASLAAAAGLLLLLAWWTWKPAPLAVRPHSDALVRPVPSAPEPFRESMEKASSAVVSLTSRTAQDTVEQTSALWPLMSQPALEPLAPMGAALEPPFEPIREATTGVSAPLAPLADSARRAVGLFLRDLPLTRSPAKNPG